MPTRPVPPAGPQGDPSLDVSSVTLQATASCVTWNVCPPIVRLPTRGTVVEFGLTPYTSVPDAEPDPPDVMETQLGTDVVSNAHPGGVVTTMEPGPPSEVADAL